MKIAALTDDGELLTFNNPQGITLDDELGEASFDYKPDDQGVQRTAYGSKADTNAALADYFGLELRHSGTPIDPDDIRKGDWYRVEYEIVRPKMELRTSDLIPATQTTKHTSERIADGKDPRPHRFSLDTLRNVEFYLLAPAAPERHPHAEEISKALRGIDGIDPTKTDSIADALAAVGVKVGYDS